MATENATRCRCHSLSTPCALHSAAPRKVPRGDDGEALPRVRRNRTDRYRDREPDALEFMQGWR